MLWDPKVETEVCHMWPSLTVAAAASPTTTSFDFFSKEGRKIGVGDCALFKPPKDAPPFIGIIRKLTFERENSVILSVNWLYRPSDIKLANGALLEAAPNKIFYSFHKNEIPAVSLLHPCKVAFLGKCVELPSGICSFVCRRVYDIENGRLCLLTDKNYINERHEEVDQLLDKTRLEMNGVVQSGSRSQKSLNGPTPTPQLKSGSDSVQNNTLFSSQVKGKKRERGDQGFDPSKRERLLKIDVDSGMWVAESMLRSEISKITEKGGLIDFPGVERLVQLMQPSSADKKIDLAGRIMLVDVIAATDRYDFLGRFVQLRGLPVLDEWLQEVRKGKIGNVGRPEESDNSVEEFLFALLRALDKLPVNLHALQTCNVGKSVNHLRSHKNSEIQKKARSLVDTWKKRVEVEMNMIDAKTGGRVAWTTKPVPSEVSHVVNRKSGGPAEVKSVIDEQSLIRNSDSKLSPADALARLSQSPGSLKPLTAAGSNTKDSNIRTSVPGEASDLAPTANNEERSSSSGQSQNNIPCSSSDHAKTVGSSYKEDARSSTAGSVVVNKVSSDASRHRKWSNGLHGSLGSGVPKEVGSSDRNSASVKGSPSILSNEKPLDTAVADHGNNQRLIVRLSNISRSPSRVVSGGFEDSSVLSNRASPLPEKEDNLNRKVESKGDTLQANTCQPNQANKNLDACNGKIESAALEEGNVAAAVDDRGRVGDDGEKCLEGLKASGSTYRLLPNSGKSYDSSFSSINALIESCANFSETNASAFPEDDVGMNLLASVAASEIPKSENTSPAGSHTPEELCPANDKISGHMFEGSKTQCQHDFGANILPTDKNGTSLGQLQAKNGPNCPAIPTATVSCDEMMRECIAALSASSINLQRVGDGQHLKPDVKHCEPTLDASAGVNSSDTKKENETESSIKFDESSKSGIQRGRRGTISDSKSTCKTPVLDTVKKVEQVGETTVKSTIFATTESVLSEKVKNEVLGENRDAADLDSSCGKLTDEKPAIEMVNNPSSIAAQVEDAALCSGIGSVLPNKCDSYRAVDKNSSLALEIEKRIMVPGPTSGDSNTGASALPVDSAVTRVPEKQQHQNSSGCKLDAEGERKKERLAPGTQTSGSAGSSGMALKVDFDLNEGFSTEVAAQGEPVKPVISGRSSTAHLSVLPFPIHSVPGSIPTSITNTVAAAAKGPFVLPEKPMRSKGEAGWRGSAATSAFRPAEPRKNLWDVPVIITSEAPTLGNTVGRQGRLPLDFDLNVADEQVLEDAASQALHPETRSRDSDTGGLELDLNRVDDGVDNGSLSRGSFSKFEIPPGFSRSSFSGGLSNGRKASIAFDLNNGPGLDELGTETAPHSFPARSNLPFAAAPGVRMSTTEIGKNSSWFPQGRSYSGISVPSLLPGRREHIAAAAESQRTFAPPAGSSSFGPEIYRCPVLSSSPAVAFSPGAAFQYQGFPFETNFPLLSTSFPGNSAAYLESSSGAALCFPTNPSQMVGPFPRPYIMSLPGSTGHVGAENRNWGSLPLDLNAGPSGTDTERRDERLPAALRQISGPSSLALTEEQMKMYQVTGSMLKRKEPDGGCDGADRFGYKHSPWQ